MENHYLAWENSHFDWAMLNSELLTYQRVRKKLWGATNYKQLGHFLEISILFGKYTLWGV